MIVLLADHVLDLGVAVHAMRTVRLRLLLLNLRLVDLDLSWLATCSRGLHARDSDVLLLARSVRA